MPFNASQEWPVVQQFHRWEEPRNQEYLLEAGWGILTATEFTMIIAANTEREVLAHMATSLEKQTTCDWQRHFEDLAHWIDYLGWAYVPLKHGEHDHAFFVTRKSDKQWIEALCERLDAAGYRSAKLHRHEGRTHWDGPLVL